MKNEMLAGVSFATIAVLLIAWPVGSREVPFSPHTVHAAFDGARCVRTADLDGDGDLDVFVTASSTTASWWCENDGTPAVGDWTLHVVQNTAEGCNWIEAGDVDGDGDLDLLGAARLDDEIAWWPNRGGQFSLQTIDIAPTASSRQIPRRGVASCLEPDRLGAWLE